MMASPAGIPAASVTGVFHSRRSTEFCGARGSRNSPVVVSVSMDSQPDGFKMIPVAVTRCTSSSPMARRSVSPAGVLMANLLSLQLSARDVIPLFTTGDGPAQLLRGALDTALLELRYADSFESYDDLSEPELAVESLAAASAAAIPVEWWTAITVLSPLPFVA